MNDVVFNLESVGDNSQKDSVALTILQVNKVEILGKGNSINDDDNLDANSHPTHPVGKRVFPDARIESGGVIGSPKDVVNVKITLNKAVPFETDLFSRSFDIDDPSLSGGQIDDESKPEDNRGGVDGHKHGMLQGGEGPLGISKVTFVAGEDHKTTEFKVTKQPGDNFRIVAHNDKEFLDYVSDVLTVWRQLHYELDSLLGVADICNIANTQKNPKDLRDAVKDLRKLIRDAGRDHNDLPPEDDFCMLPKQPDIGFLKEFLSKAYIYVPHLDEFDQIKIVDEKDGIPFSHHIEATRNGVLQLNYNIRVNIKLLSELGLGYSYYSSHKIKVR